jgi:hypothetical protein
LQNNVALSSVEAELNAAVKVVSEGLGAMNLIGELCSEQCRVVLCTDASACKGIMLRQGCGKIKHLDVKSLWVQGAVESHGIVVQKVPREINPADMMTHPVSQSKMEGHLRRVQYMSEGISLKEPSVDSWWSTPLPRVKWADATISTCEEQPPPTFSTHPPSVRYEVLPSRVGCVTDPLGRGGCKGVEPNLVV